MKFDKNCSIKIKGIAIILMLFHHLFRVPDLYKGYEINWFPMLENQVVLLADMSKICVAMFAFISGYGMTLKIKRSQKYNLYKSQIKSLIFRFMTLFIPILIAGQIINQRPQNFYFSDNLIQGVVYLVVDVLGLSNLLGLTPYYGAYWYISAAIIFIIIVPIIYSIMKSKGVFFTLAIIVILPRLFGIGYIQGNAAYPFVFSLALGCVFAENDYMEKILNWHPMKGNNKWLSNLWVIIIGMLCMGVSYHLYKNLPIEKYWEINWGIIPVVFICFCSRFVVNIPVINLILKWLGKYSMSIYIVHVFFIGYYKDILYNTKYFWMAVLLLLTFSFLTALIIEKVELLLFNLINKVNIKLRRTQ